jgi:hypothetical protein
MMRPVIRWRFNTNPNAGEWRWRVFLPQDEGVAQVLVKGLSVSVPSWTQEDNLFEQRKWHMAAHGTFRMSADGYATIGEN